MNIEEINRALGMALAMRPPRWAPNGATPVGASHKVSQLEDYLMESAYVAADLEEAIFWLEGAIAESGEKIERMTGYEVALPRKTRDRLTQADVLNAKRTVDPDTFGIHDDAKRLRASILRQIERLRFEEQWVISRAYSLISGS
jgi:hypothetical protein